MKITICCRCGDVPTQAVMHEQRTYCAECAMIYGITTKPRCTVCRAQPAVYEPRQQPVHSAHRTYICEDCATEIDMDEEQWEMIN